MSWHAGSYRNRQFDHHAPPPIDEGPPPPPRDWGRLKLALRLMVVLAFGAAGVWLYQSPVFAVSHVEVKGLQHLNEESVLDRVSLTGQNLLNIPTAQIQQTLQEDPWVRRVEVQRQLPNKVTLNVEERSPVAIWEGKGGRFIIDRDGMLIEPAPKSGPLPVLLEMNGPLRQTGGRGDGDAAELAAKLVESLPGAIGQKAKSFEYQANGGLVVETDKGRRARFGDGADFEYKLAVWKALLAKGAVDKLNVGHVDLRFGDRPFFRDN